jgi:hypothetical protein
MEKYLIFLLYFHGFWLSGLSQLRTGDNRSLYTILGLLKLGISTLQEFYCYNTQITKGNINTHDSNVYEVKDNKLDLMFKNTIF